MIVLYWVFALFLMFGLGYSLCAIRIGKPKGKKLEEISDRELLMLQFKVFDEISKRGAKLIEPFEEFGGKDGHNKENES